MYSTEVHEKNKRREEEENERERLALKKKDVRRKVRKYDRRQGRGKTEVCCLGPGDYIDMT